MNTRTYEYADTNGLIAQVYIREGECGEYGEAEIEVVRGVCSNYDAQIACFNALANWRKDENSSGSAAVLAINVENNTQIAACRLRVLYLV